MLKIKTTLLLALCTLANGQIISTIVGGGPKNLQALQTGLCQSSSLPAGVAVDSTGNVYVSATSCGQIWKIASSGVVSVFAGNGVPNYDANDGGLAVNAALNGPKGLAFDIAGNLYVATDGSRIRKISTTGVITTVAGNGFSGFSGDSGQATSAMLNKPVSVALDSANNLYIADTGNQRVRMVSPSGVITTFAGNGTAAFTGDGGPAALGSLNGPNGVAADSAGSVYIADAGNYRVRKVTGGMLSTVAGTGVSGYTGDGGPATSATLNTIKGVIVDQYNTVFIVEAYDIRQIPSGQVNISTFAGTGVFGYSGDGGSPTLARLSNAKALAFDAAAFKFYLVDTNNLRLVSSGGISTFAGNGSVDFNSNGMTATNASIYYPVAIAADNAGSVYFGDLGSYSVRKLNLNNGLLTTAAGSGVSGSTADGLAATGPLVGPFAVALDAAGNLYIGESNRVRKVSGGIYSSVANASNTGGFFGDGGQASLARFNGIEGLAVGPNNDVYIADFSNHRIRMVSGATGIVVTVAGNGTATSTGDGGLGTNATLNYPYGLALDGAGNLFISEFYGARIRKLSLSTNIITTVAGDGTQSFADGVLATATGVSYVKGIFVDQSGNLFLADQGHQRIRKVTAGSNIISTVGGTGAFNFSGDGGPATSASFLPNNLTVDRSQNLYVADFTGRIRIFPVAACFFTFGTPSYTATSAGGAGTMPVSPTNSSCPYAVSSSSNFVTITSGASGTGSGLITFSIAANTGSARTATVQVGGASFTVTQAAANAQYNVGFFQPSGPQWVLDSNGNGVYDAADKLFAFAGQAGAIAVVGDWNGDGRSKVGYYLNGFWALDYNGNGIYDPGVDKFYAFGGGPGYIPVVGDWNGDGRTKVGYYHDGFWALDTNGNGTFDAGDGFFGYGGRGPAEVPIVGDWNGDHRSKIGFFFNGTWVLDYDGNGTFGAADKYYTNFTFVAGDKPVVGDWNGDGTSKIGIYRGGFWILDYNGNGSYDGIGAGADKFYGFGGNAGETPLVADWNGDGRSKIGVYLNGFWELDFNGNGSYDGTGVGGDRFLGYYGGAGSQPIIGRW